MDRSCYIQQYVDHDTTAGASDFTCSGLSYDGHKGTDFALITLRQMEDGVNVLSAAEGRVADLRDGMKDQILSSKNRSDFQGKDCGNGVVITHENGWTTQYCHMKQDSIRVQKGQKVAAGEILGQIGLSGRTEFPHLHLTVRKDQKVIDPFHPKDRINCTTSDQTTDQTTLWKDPLDYRAGGLLSAGFSDAVPDYATIKTGTATGPQLTRGSNALVLWVYGFGLRAEDVLRFEIRGPKGTVFAHDATMPKAQAQMMRAAGLKRKQNLWPKGAYQGIVKLIRNGNELENKIVQFEF